MRRFIFNATVKTIITLSLLFFVPRIFLWDMVVVALREMRLQFRILWMQYGDAMRTDHWSGLQAKKDRK